MFKRVKFPIDMGNGVMVRTLQGLLENFDYEKILCCIEDGRLCRWLRDRNHADIADKVETLDLQSGNTSEDLCRVLFSGLKGVAFSQEEMNGYLDNGTDRLYLCGSSFKIPLDRENIVYTGLNCPVAIVESDKLVDWAGKNITIRNCRFDEAYIENTCYETMKVIYDMLNPGDNSNGKHYENLLADAGKRYNKFFMHGTGTHAEEG